MSFGDNLAIAGIILALAGIGIPIRWPNQKWIGSLCVVLAGAVIVLWIGLAVRSHNDAASIVAISSSSPALPDNRPEPKGEAKAEPDAKKNASDRPALVSKLQFSAVATNILHPNEPMLNGIKWHPSWIELHLIIDNQNEYPIQNLDLTIDSFGSNPLLKMGQITNLSDIELKPPPLPSMPIKLKPADGGPLATFDATDDLNAFAAGPDGFSSATQYQIFAGRLRANTILKLLIAIGKTEKSPAPKKLRIFGSYELMPSEGGNRISVDNTFDVDGAPK